MSRSRQLARGQRDQFELLDVVRRPVRSTSVPPRGRDELFGRRDRHAATSARTRPSSSSLPRTICADSSGSCSSVSIRSSGSPAPRTGRDAGELLDLAAEGLLVQALHVAAGALLHRGCDEDLDEGRAPRPCLARGADFLVGRDRRDEHRCAVARVSSDATQPMRSMFVSRSFEKPRPFERCVADDVAVEVLDDGRGARARGRRARRSSSSRRR